MTRSRVLQVLAGIDLDAPPAPRCAVVTDGVRWFDAVRRRVGRHRLALHQAGSDEAATAARTDPGVRVGRRVGRAAVAEQVSADVSAGIERGRGSMRGEGGGSTATRLIASERAARRQFQFASLLITPTVPGPAPALGHEVSVADASRSTRPLSGFGWPCISVPCGTVDGCPVGVQLVAAPGDDARLLGWAAQAVATLTPPEAQHA